MKGILSTIGYPFKLIGSLIFFVAIISFFGGGMEGVRSFFSATKQTAANVSTYVVDEIKEANSSGSGFFSKNSRNSSRKRSRTGKALDRLGELTYIWLAELKHVVPFFVKTAVVIFILRTWGEGILGIIPKRE